MSYKIITLIAALIPCLSAAATKGTSQDKPNIIVILADDLGYNDLGCYGAEKIRTPRLDAMAAQGLRFTQAYAANSLCSPSRAALLTGRYATRDNMPEVVGPEWPGSLSPQAVLLPELLGDAGYATMALGKWHIGHKKGDLPTERGFDRFFGIPYSNDMNIDPEATLAPGIRLNRDVTIEGIRSGDYARGKTNPGNSGFYAHERYYIPLMRDREVIEFPADQTLLTRRFTDAAIQFVTENRDAPFFLYLAHPMPHVPLAVSPEFVGHSEAGLYGDAVEELDHETGRLLDTLQKLGLDKSTLVFFASDNGPWDLAVQQGGSAAPLRGYKFQTHEGGQRVPLIARWPSRLPAGKSVDSLVSLMDIFPTALRLAGEPVPDGLKIDGHDLNPFFEDAGAPSTYDRFFFIRGWEVLAVREGAWKLQQGLTGTPYRQQRIPGNPGELYNLKKDIGETTDVADENPEIFQHMLSTLKEMQAETDADRPAETPK